MRGPVVESLTYHERITRPVRCWRFAEPVPALATSVLGGGFGRRSWILNAQVDQRYHHDDPAVHAAQIAAQLGLPHGEGIGLLTAARVADAVSGDDGGVMVDATVGITVPTWAAGLEGSWSRWQPGTINLLCWVPAALTGAALANALVTVTEAKTQALIEAGVPGTGTASDAVALCCLPGATELYGGPRSRWGAPLARAVHRAVRSGIGQFMRSSR